MLDWCWYCISNFENKISLRREECEIPIFQKIKHVISHRAQVKISKMMGLKYNFRGVNLKFFGNVFGVKFEFFELGMGQ